MRSVLVLTVSFLAGIFALVAGAAAVGGLGATSAREAALPYAECLALLDEAMGETDAVVSLVDTAEGRSAQFQAADGVVSVSCHRATGMVVLKGQHSAPRVSSR